MRWPEDANRGCVADVSRFRRSPVPRDSTTSCALVQLKLVAAVLNSSALPPGKNSGQRWLTSPLARRVKVCGIPPTSDTWRRTEADAGPKTIIPRPLQLAPRGNTASARVCAAPPLTEIFFSLLPAKNPSHWLSGEKKGLTAPSVPGIGAADKLSMARK